MDIYLLIAILSLIGLILTKTGIDVYFYFKYRERVGGSGALPSNGDLHGVRECNVSGESLETEAPVNGSLEKITDTENKCVNCGSDVYTKDSFCVECRTLLHMAFVEGS